MRLKITRYRGSQPGAIRSHPGGVYAAVTATKDEPPAAVQTAIAKVAGWGRVLVVD
jgi:hypothetical protein